MTKFKKNDSLKQNNKNTFYFLTPQSAFEFNTIWHWTEG